MDAEYVRISDDEKSYGYKSLLHSQLEFLNLMRCFKNYQELRKKEFGLRVSLKSKVGETLSGIEKFEEMLPKVPMKEDIPLKKKEIKKEVKKEPSGLMGEINMIRAKLERLQRGI